MLQYSLSQFLVKIKITTTILYSQKNVGIIQLKKNDKFFFDSIIILRFGDTKVGKENLYGAKKAIKILNVNVNNVVISKLVETKESSKYLSG